MEETENVAPERPTSGQPIPADRLLLEIAGSLDFNAVKLRHRDWTGERIRALLEEAAKHLRPDYSPSFRDRLNALLPAAGIFVVAPFLVSFSRAIQPLLLEVAKPLPVLTRLVLNLQQLKVNPMLLIWMPMVAFCIGWAWKSRRKLRICATGSYMVALGLALTYLLVCLYPVLIAVLQGRFRFGL